MNLSDEHWKIPTVTAPMTHEILGHTVEVDPAYVYRWVLLTVIREH